MEWLDLIKNIPYGKAGMIIGFVLVLLLIIFWFMDRTQKRAYDHLSKFLDYLMKRGGRP